MTFFKTRMNVNWHRNYLLKCHLNVTCLVVHVILTCKVSIDVWVFFFTTWQNLNYARQLMWFYFCASCCMSNIKNLQKKHCPKYTLHVRAQPMFDPWGMESLSHAMYNIVSIHCKHKGKFLFLFFNNPSLVCTFKYATEKF